MKKILFMGTPDYAQKILQTILQQKEFEVVAVFTQMDKPVGRKKILTPPAVKTLAQEHNIKVYQPKSLQSDQAIADVLAIGCDFIVVAAYGQILPKEILKHAPCINLHASVLPKYRGASPIQQALLNGDTTTGVTAMLMDEGLDTGDILAIKECVIEPDETAVELFEKLTQIAAVLSVEVLENFTKLTPQPQDDTQASYCKKITKADGQVEFVNAQSLYNTYRAFTPWPGVFLPSGLKLKKMQLHQKEGMYAKGEILECTKEYAIIGTAKGSIKLFRVQPQSKKEMDIYSYINGKRLQVGDTVL